MDDIVDRTVSLIRAVKKLPPGAARDEIEVRLRQVKAANSRFTSISPFHRNLLLFTLDRCDSLLRENHSSQCYSSLFFPFFYVLTSNIVRMLVHVRARVCGYGPVRYRPPALRILFAVIVKRRNFLLNFEDPKSKRR